MSVPSSLDDVDPRLRFAGPPAVASGLVTAVVLLATAVLVSINVVAVVSFATMGFGIYGAARSFSTTDKVKNVDDSGATYYEWVDVDVDDRDRRIGGAFLGMGVVAGVALVIVSERLL